MSLCRLRSSEVSTRRAIGGVVAAVAALAVALTLWAPRPAAADPVVTTQTPAAAPATPTAPAVVTIMTFGYRFGRAPKGCKFVADVRNVRAPAFSPKQTGLMASVRKRVMRTAGAKKWHRVMLTKWLPRLHAGDKVAIGCKSGHHRSVSLAVVFAADLRAHGFKVVLKHRDIKKRY